MSENEFSPVLKGEKLDLVKHHNPLQHHHQHHHHQSPPEQSVSPNVNKSWCFRARLPATKAQTVTMWVNSVAKMFMIIKFSIYQPNHFFQQWSSNSPFTKSQIRSTITRDLCRQQWKSVEASKEETSNPVLASSIQHVNCHNLSQFNKSSQHNSYFDATCHNTTNLHETYFVTHTFMTPTSGTPQQSSAPPIQHWNQYSNFRNYAPPSFLP